MATGHLPTGGKRDGLRERAVSSISVYTFGQVGSKGLQFVIGIVMARLLFPEDFGLLGMILVFTSITQLFANMGFSTAMVHRREVRPEHYHSVFWLSLGMGTALMLLFMAAAPLVAAFYAEPRLTPLCYAMAANFVLDALLVVPYTILQKRLQFMRITMVNLGAVVLSGTASMVMAWMGWGVWSLIAQFLLCSLLVTTGNWVACAWWPRLVFSRQAIAELLHFGINAVGASAIMLVTRNLGQMFIGKALGADPTGIYTRTLSMVLLPLVTIVMGFSQVMSPLLTELREDKPRAARYFLRLSWMAMLLLIPGFLFIAIVSDYFVQAVYGPKWLAMIEVLRVMCVVGIVQALVSLHDVLYLSQNRPDQLLWLNVAKLATQAAGIWIGLQWGVVGVAWGLLAAHLAIAVPAMLPALGKVGSGPGALLAVGAGVMVSAAAMGGAVVAVRLLLPAGWSPWLRLGLLTVVAGLAYVGALAAGRVSLFREALGMLLAKLGRQPPVISP